MGRKQFTREAREAILARDHDTCVYCGVPAAFVDHVLPLCESGPSSQANGVAVCQRCNSQKSGHLAEDFIRRGFYALLCAGESLAWLDKLERSNG